MLENHFGLANQAKVIMIQDKYPINEGGEILTP